MDITRRIGQLRNYKYGMLMTLLEAQVRNIIRLRPVEAREEDIQEVLCIITAAMPLNNGAIEVGDTKVANYLSELLHQIKRQEFPQEETKVVSIWEDN